MQDPQCRDQKEKASGDGKSAAIFSEEKPLSPDSQAVVRNDNRQKKHQPVMSPKLQLDSQCEGSNYGCNEGKVGSKGNRIFECFGNQGDLVAGYESKQSTSCPQDQRNGVKQRPRKDFRCAPVLPGAKSTANFRRKRLDAS